MSVVKLTRGNVKEEKESETPSSSTSVTPARNRVRTRTEQDTEPTRSPWVDQDDKCRAARAKVFEMCTITNWKELRLVCKSWNDEITPILYSTVEFNIDKYLDCIEKVNTDEHQVEFPWELTAIPFQKYKLEDCYVGETGWIRMWHELGNRMKSLRISSTVSIDDVEFIRNALFASTPNLEELTFHAKMFNESKQTLLIMPKELEQPHLKMLEIGVHSEMLDVDGLMRLYPNLENLRLRILDTDSEQDLTTFLRHIYAIRKEDPNKFSNLKHINIIGANAKSDDSVNETLWKLICPGITNAPLTLSTLALDIGPTIGTSAPVLHSILKFCEKTIRTLDLYFLYRAPDGPSFEGFPFGVEFPNLKVFRATGKIVHTMEFLRFMPKLTTLHLTDLPKILSPEDQTSFESLEGLWCLEDMKLEPIQAAGPSVRHFFCGYLVDGSDILALGKMMPNLQNVCLPLYDDVDLKRVLGAWSHLTHLYMLQTQNEGFDLSAAFKHPRLVRFVQVVPKHFKKVIEELTPSQLVPWFYKKNDYDEDDN